MILGVILGVLASILLLVTVLSIAKIDSRKTINWILDWAYDLGKTIRGKITK